MPSTHHPHLIAAVRSVVATIVLGATVVACGSNGDEPTLSPAGEAGRDIVRSNGCAACHGRNGQGGPGPSFVGLYGSEVELKDDTFVTADDDYLYRAISDPSAELVAGYGFPMPENDLTDEQIASVIDFIRELGTTEADS
jgi:cytochrome c oxidase subunit 2